MNSLCRVRLGVRRSQNLARDRLGVRRAKTGNTSTQHTRVARPTCNDFGFITCASLPRPGAHEACGLTLSGGALRCSGRRGLGHDRELHVHLQPGEFWVRRCSGVTCVGDWLTRGRPMGAWTPTARRLLDYVGEAISKGMTCDTPASLIMRLVTLVGFAPATMLTRAKLRILRNLAWHLIDS